MAQRGRIDLIQRMVVEERTVSVSELSKHFQVTEETIRRDLEKLENKGVLNRTYGGAVLNTEFINQNTIHFSQRSQINAEAKMMIAQKANALLAQETVIGADASSTVMELIRTLEGRSNLTIVTNSVGVLLECVQSNINVLSTGGFLNPKSMSLQGVAAQNTIKNYHLDIVFISCKALEKSAGIFDTNEYEAVLKSAMVKQTQKVVLLVDHTKFDKTSFVKIIGFDKIDCLITDEKPSEEWMETFQQHGIEVIY